ncbi:MAG: ATP-binding protein [Bacteroidales bacterium]|nr:ATP-binding protein [Bacteroidales bacterium]
MKVKNYLPRIYDALLSDMLQRSGAVLVAGPKWCSKTATSLQATNSVIFMQDPDKGRAYMTAADTKPSLLLEGETPRLIDEWQMAPVLWDAVRFAVDQRGEVGQFVLTGSAVPLDNATMHTGTGRIARLVMRTMSLYESGESNGSVSLKDLFDGNPIEPAICSLDVDDYARLICRGGWPAAVNMKGGNNLKVVQDYVDAIINQDVSRVDGVERNPRRVQLLLRSLSRNIATMASNVTILKDIEANETSFSVPTLDNYLNALRRIFVIEDQNAWQPSLRSKTAIRTSSKRHFTDPSIAAAALRISPEVLLKDFNTFGFFFESLCTRDMRIYAQACDGEVLHYRDKNDLEADMIIALRDGRWAAVEVKLGNSQIEEAAAHLLQLAKKINTEKMGNPSFLMVLTGGELAYQRADGVYVVPIGCMRN